MSDEITLAHISDVHLSPVRGLWPHRWNVKRLLGYANWVTRRSRVHRREIVDILTSDLETHNIDHLIVTGDLVNLGLPAEIRAAHDWLTSVGPSDLITAIPGNHDVYGSAQAHVALAPWRDYMSSNEAGAALVLKARGSGMEAPSHAFPFCRIIGPVALIGLNSAIPTLPFVAAGNLGSAQREALGKILAEARAQNLIRIVTIHHPPLPGQATKRRGLRDAAELQSLIECHGAELVLHGHNHQSTTAWCKGSNDSIPVIGVPSGSAAVADHDEPLARYNVIRVTRHPSSARIDIASRGTKRLGNPLSDIALQSFEVRLGGPRDNEAR